MESKKRKREDDASDCVLTFYAPNDRVFERVLKETSLQELKKNIRGKITAGEGPFKLAQVRDGHLVDLDDEDDFEALQTRASAIKSIDIIVSVGKSSDLQIPPHYVAKPTLSAVAVEDDDTQRKKKRKKNLNAGVSSAVGTPTKGIDASQQAQLAFGSIQKEPATTERKKHVSWSEDRQIAREGQSTPVYAQVKHIRTNAGVPPSPSILKKHPQIYPLVPPLSGVNPTASTSNVPVSTSLTQAAIAAVKSGKTSDTGDKPSKKKKRRRESQLGGVEPNGQDQEHRDATLATTPTQIPHLDDVFTVNGDSSKKKKRWKSERENPQADDNAEAEASSERSKGKSKEPNQESQNSKVVPETDSSLATTSQVTKKEKKKKAKKAMESADSASPSPTSDATSRDTKKEEKKAKKAKEPAATADSVSSSSADPTSASQDAKKERKKKKKAKEGELTTDSAAGPSPASNPATPEEGVEATSSKEKKRKSKKAEKGADVAQVEHRDPVSSGEGSKKSRHSKDKQRVQQEHDARSSQPEPTATKPTEISDNASKKALTASEQIVADAMAAVLARAKASRQAALHQTGGTSSSSGPSVGAQPTSSAADGTVGAVSSNNTSSISQNVAAPQESADATSTSAKAPSTRKLKRDLPCAICHASHYHVPSQCPIVKKGLEPLAKRVAELKQEGADPKLISNLEKKVETLRAKDSSKPQSATKSDPPKKPTHATAPSNDVTASRAPETATNSSASATSQSETPEVFASGGGTVELGTVESAIHESPTPPPQKQPPAQPSISTKEPLTQARPTNATSSPAPRIPAGSEISEVVVQSQGEGSSDEESESESESDEDTTAFKGVNDPNPPVNIPAPAPPPAVSEPLDSADLEALLHGPARRCRGRRREGGGSV
ncbi:hypothetical protein K474DRAFT_66421 [Panus rudis PR-1116 ss-1]|nr:hypothetical protein K474DRAFT_66421 [Panus rudis PR-1116 ss-1]